MLWLSRKRNDIVFLIISFLTSIFSTLPLFHRGFFSSDDGEWMIIRFSAFHQALVQGQFPVRLLARLNHEYGYPVANFLYPGFMYLAEIPKLLGFGLVDSIKIILGLSMVGSAVFAYLWLAKIFDKFSALIGSVVFLYAPYHLFDIYTRGSVGEVLALAVVPFILWQLERESVFFTTVGLALLIISHNTLALLFLPLILCYMVLNVYIAKKREKLIRMYLYILVFSLQISAFFWVPAIFDLQFTVFSKTPVSDWSRYFVGFDLTSFSMIIIFLTTMTLFLSRKVEFARYRLTALFFILGVFSLFLSTILSKPLWQALPVSFIQFPFRFLSVTILCTAFLATFVLSITSGKLKRFLTLGIVVLALFSSKPFITPSAYFDKGEGFYATNEDTTTVRNEYMPKWVKTLPTERPKELVQFIVGSGNIENVWTNAKEVHFSLKTKNPVAISINKIYFPGWKAFINKKEVELLHDNTKGLMLLSIPPGDNSISLVFGETRVRILSDIVSVLGLLGLIIFVRMNHEKFHQK